MNYRAAELSERHRAMLDFTWKLSESPEKITEEDREILRERDLTIKIFGIFQQLLLFLI